MQAVILAAGKATRMGGQYKPVVMVGGYRAIEWQRPQLPKQITIVGPTNPGVFLPRDCDFFGFDGGGGPVQALAAVLPHLSSEELLVVYADTLWWGDTPDSGDWFGVAKAKGGRVWDIASPEGKCGRFFVAEDRTETVCVGAYRFSDLEKLAWACEEALNKCPETECHMFRVVNLLNMTPVPFKWLDVGDPEALAFAEAELKGQRP